MAKLPLLNVSAAQEGDEEAVRYLLGQFAIRLECLSTGEADMLRGALERLAAGCEVRQAFAPDGLKAGPKASERWRKDYALWLEFDELADFERQQGRTPIRSQIFEAIANRHSRLYGGEVKFSSRTVERAVRRIEQAKAEHDSVTDQERQ